MNGICIVSACLVVLVSAACGAAETDLRGSESYPQSDPSGAVSAQWIVFSRGGPEAGIYAMDVETRRTVSLLPGDYRSPAVAPDGRTLAFETFDNQVSRIAISKLDQSSGTPVAGPVEILAPGHSPAWAPDSQRIALARDEEGIYVLTLPERSERRLSDDDALLSHLTFSPDGRRLAVSSLGKGVSTVDAESGRPAGDLVSDPLAKALDWRPWGVIFTTMSVRPLAHQIMIKRAGEPSRPIGIAQPHTMISSLSARDKRTIVFVRTPISTTPRGVFRQAELYLLDLESETETQLTKNDLPDGDPSWLPRPAP